MRRTLILSALSATTLSIGLGVGATLASSDPAQPSATVTTTMMGYATGGHIHDGAGMTHMQGSTGMNGGMDADDMNANHAAMHAAMSDHMSADQLALCDSAHTRMTTDQSSSVMPSSNAEHMAHHQGAQP